MTITLPDLAPREIDDPIAKLFELGGELVAKHRTPGVERVKIDDLQVDHAYQRPPDREKIREFVEHLRAGGTLPPVKVNRRPDGSLWITDGQHRAAARAILGEDQVDAVVTEKPQQDEPQETNLVAKEAAGRIPAGDSRRGRIHPGEWTKENNPATLKAAAEEAHSHVEKAVIHHRLSQLRGEHAVAGRLGERELAATREKLAKAKQRMTAAGARQALADSGLADGGQYEHHARGTVLGYAWRDTLTREAFEKHPAVRKARSAEKRKKAAYDKTHEQLSQMNWSGTPQERTRAQDKARKARAAWLETQAEISRLRRELAGPDKDVAQTLGVNHAAHLKKHEAKIKREVKRMLDRDVGDIRAKAVGEAKQHADALATHRAASSAAKAKATAARRETPRFERQSLAGRWLGDLKAHPGQLRAMFLEDSPLADGLAYSEWTRPLVKVKQRQMHLSMGGLQSTLAQTYGHNGFPEPVAEAWRALYSDAVKVTGNHLTRGAIEAHLKKHGVEIKGRQRTAVIAAALHEAQEFGGVDEVVGWERSKTPMFRTHADVPEAAEDDLVDAMIGAGAKVTDNEFYLPDYRSWADSKMDQGKRFTLDLGQGRQVHYVPHVTVGTRQVPKYTHTFTYGGWSAQKKAAILKRIDARVAAVPDYSPVHQQLIALRTAVETAPKQPVSFTVETESFKPPELYSADVRDAAKALGRKLPTAVKTALGYGSTVPTEHLLEHSREKSQGRATEPHKAPFSERGVIRCDGMPPADAVKILKRLGMTSGLTPEVPYNLIYRSGRRLGRVHPQHEDYATGEQALQVADNIGVFHGLTGHGNTVEQVKRLIADGGIKSIAERRRLGRTQGGMSVKGDTGSGIDQYVFATSTPHYGSGSVVFGMKPSALKRRDIAFAPRDYGGGGDRWEKYNAHARRIGQGALHTPPGHESRQRHLDKHTGASNAEVLLKHEIPWSDVDTMHVNADHHKAIARLVKAAQRRGDVPEHVRVVPFQSMSHVAARNAELSVDDG